MRDHKSLLAWQRAHAVASSVIDVCRAHWRPFASATFDQLQRASLSVQLNISEGYALKSPKRFHNHLTIAYGSAVETIDLLELLVEKELLPAEAAKETRAAALDARHLLLGLLRKYR